MAINIMEFQAINHSLHDNFNRPSGIWTDITTHAVITHTGGNKVIQKTTGDYYGGGMILSTPVLGKRGRRFIFEFKSANFTTDTATDIQIGVRKDPGPLNSQYVGYYLDDLTSQNGEGRTIEFFSNIEIIDPATLTKDESHTIEMRINDDGYFDLFWDDVPYGTSGESMGTFISQPCYFFVFPYYPQFDLVCMDFKVIG